MAWCPKCKSEYVDGIARCTDCDCELVEKLEDTKDEVSAWEEEVAARAFYAMQKEEQDAEEKTEEEKKVQNEKPVYVTAYVNNEEKAEENRTSAYTLLLVGGVGFIIIVLFFFDMLPYHGIGISKYMISGVMGVLFFLFIVMGIVSMKNSKILEKKAKKENNLTQEIKKWCLEHMVSNAIDEELFGEDETTEELKYFGRAEKMKQMIQNQFMNLDEGYLDRLIDEIYPEIFETE